MTLPTAKMICMHHDYVAANKRVSRSKRLLPYQRTILSHSGDTHWQFVCCAPIKDIVQWAIRQQLLEQRGQPERLSDYQNHILQTAIANLIWVFRMWRDHDELSLTDWRFHLENLAELEQEFPALVSSIFPTIESLRKDLREYEEEQRRG